VLVLFLIACPAWGYDDPVWTFDFREVFYDADFVSPGDAVIVGGHGHILATHHRHRKLWSPRGSGTKEVLTCLDFVDGEHGWAAGHGGIILHTADSGRTWEVQRASSPGNQPIFDIQFVSKRVGYACGAYDTLLKTEDGGKSWGSLSMGRDNIYNGLFFLDEETGYLVGEFGTVLRTTDGGRSWERIDPGGFQGSLFGILLPDPETILVFGIAGKVMRSEDRGRTWTDRSPGVHASLFRAAISGEEILLVGGSGVILHSNDGGRSFVQRNDKDLTTFAGVCAHPETGFLLVGEKGKILRLHNPGKEWP